MKKSLGKLILTVLCPMALFAQIPASYTLSANKREAVIKEPIELTFVATQQDHTHIMSYFVKPKPSPDYTIKLLNKSTKELSSHNSTATFKYILFPLKAKRVHIAFDFTINAASDKGVASAYVTDHDESLGIEGVTSHIAVKPLEIKVRQLKHPVDLIGNFKITSDIDTKEIDQNDQVNLHYTLSGKGHIDHALFLPPIKNTEIFSDMRPAPKKLTPDGYKIETQYTYALNSKKDFVIPALSLKAYDPKQKRYYTLTTPAYPIKVTKIDPKTLLDKHNEPRKEALIDWAYIKALLINILIFAAGFITAKLSRLTMPIPKLRSTNKLDMIRKCHQPKALISTLLNHFGDRNIEVYLAKLERMVYKKSDDSFEAVKRELLHYLKSH